LLLQIISVEGSKILPPHREYSVELLLCSVEPLLGSVELLLGSVELLLGSVELLLGSVEPLLVSAELLLKRELELPPCEAWEEEEPW